MKEEGTIRAEKQIYYRLIALWTLCEALLGGIIHGLKIPVSGLIVGSAAVVCICLIAWYVPAKGAIIKATIIVAIFKMMLSPQAPPPAYIAVFFQGLMGEWLFRDKRFFRISCLLLAVVGLLESGLQRILVLTIVYGNDGWKVINDFFNGLVKQKQSTNYSLLIGSAYVLLHLVTGIVVGAWTSGLPKRITRWKESNRYRLAATVPGMVSLPAVSKKRKRLKTGLFIIWLLLIGLYTQSYFEIGTPLLPPHISLKILLRSLIIVMGWVFIIGPLLKKALHRWLKKKQTGSQQEIEEVLRLLPATEQLIAQSWQRSAGNKGWKRISTWSRIVLVNALSDGTVTASRSPGIFILTAPIQSGKTTSLARWLANRNDVYGILTPVVNGRRFFMNTHTKEQFPMEAAPGEPGTLSVGRFVFSKKNFEKAIKMARDDMYKKGWFVLDEIGPLELRGEGFSELVKEVIQGREDNILFVIREGLRDRVLNDFKMGPVVVLANMENLEEIRGEKSRQGES
ncbi:MAG: nucleoside-triphosphatase [Chitinophagaceae bacterium]